MHQKSCPEKGLTQFQLSKNLLQTLNKYDISPTSKLVLLYLADCYNPNKVSMFPKQKTLAERLGVSERSIKRAIKELSEAGLIMYETKGLLNHYRFTSKIFVSVKMSPTTGQNVGRQGDILSHDNRKHEQKKNMTYFNKNEGVKYKTPEQTKAEYEEATRTDGKSPMNDKNTAEHWLKSLTPITLGMRPILTTAQNVIKKWNWKHEELILMNRHLERVLIS